MDGDAAAQGEDSPMTDTTKPDKWAQFSDRDLVERYCRKARGQPSFHLGRTRAELIAMIEGLR